MQQLSTLLNTKEGQMIISVLLGFGLATLFRKVCKDQSCIVVKGPRVADVDGIYYRIGDTCHKYTPSVVPCAK